MAAEPGTITTWHDDKGYGFITPTAGGPAVFFHVSAVDAGRGRPAVAQAVRCTRSVDPQGRPRAASVQRVGHGGAARPRVSRVPRVPLVLTVGAVGLVGVLLVVAVLRLGLPVWVGVLYGGMSVLAFVRYGVDKRQAVQGGQRVPEATLHLLELLGGWPGAVLAQCVFRHKTQKTSYQAVFWIIVALHVVLLGWYSVRGGWR